MAQLDYFGHDDLGLNRTFVQRLRDCGYTANTSLRENIAAGREAADGTFSQFQARKGHNTTMLNPNLVAIGIGRAYNGNSQYRWYWTTEFGGVADGYSGLVRGPERSGDADCSGATNSIDALLVLQYSAGAIGQLSCASDADADGDGTIDAIDASLILQIAAGMFG